MAGYVVRRLLVIPFTLFGLSLLVFLMLQFLSPSERAALYVSGPIRNTEQLQRIIDTYGLDRPVWEQYGSWLGNLLKGDLGWSKTGQQPVFDAIVR